MKTITLLQMSISTLSQPPTGRYLLQLLTNGSVFRPAGNQSWSAFKAFIAFFPLPLRRLFNKQTENGGSTYLTGTVCLQWWWRKRSVGSLRDKFHLRSWMSVSADKKLLIKSRVSSRQFGQVCTNLPTWFSCVLPGALHENIPRTLHPLRVFLYKL